MAVRLPRLLTNSFGEECRLHPTQKVSAKISLLSLSTASMTLPDGEPTVALKRWIELYGPGGSLGLFRVAKASTTYGSAQKLGLEHGISTLETDLSPNDTTLTGTPTQILTALLGYQTVARWQLGTVAATGSYTLECNRTKVLQALMNVLKLWSGYAPRYDFTTTPWTLSIVALESTPSCEVRASRNMTGAPTITMDDSDQCTRVYATGLTNGYMDADNIVTEGVICRSLGTPEDAEAAKVQEYAAAFLAEHKNPRCSIELPVVDLSAQTGEPLDAFVVGKLCRVALPDYQTTYDERLITLSYDDLLGAPESVKATLSTMPRDTSQLLAAMHNQQNALAEESTHHGGAIRATNGRLTNAEQSLSTAWIDINEQEAKITLYAAQSSAMEGRLSQAEIQIDGAKAAILLKASQLVVDALGERVTSAEINIDGANAQIALKVAKNGVIGAINVTPEVITIQAKRVNLAGYVTASQLSSSLALIATSAIDDLTVGTHLQVNGGATFAGAVGITGNLYYKSSQIGKESLEIVTGVSLRKEFVTVPGANGVSYYVMSGASLSVSTETINYLGC